MLELTFSNEHTAYETNLNLSSTYGETLCTEIHHQKKSRLEFPREHGFEIPEIHSINRSMQFEHNRKNIFDVMFDRQNGNLYYMTT